MDPKVVEMRTGKVWLREDGILYFVASPNTEQTAEDALENIRAGALASDGVRRPGLVDMRQIKSIAYDARLAYTGPENAKVLSAVAILIGSPTSRVLGNFFLGVNKMPMPVQLFTSEAQALDWLGQFLPEDRRPAPRVIETRGGHMWLRDDGIIHYLALPNVDQTAQDAEDIIRAGAEVAGGVRRPGFVDLRPIRSIDRGARLFYAGSLSASVNTALALLVESPFSRIVGNLFLGTTRPSFPCRMFTSEAEALAWLKGFLPEAHDHPAD